MQKNYKTLNWSHSICNYPYHKIRLYIPHSKYHKEKNNNAKLDVFYSSHLVKTEIESNHKVVRTSKMVPMKLQSLKKKKNELSYSSVEGKLKNTIGLVATQKQTI